MIELVMTSVALEPKLLQCTQSSLVGSVVQAAQLGLMPGINGECWLLPFRNTQKGCSEVQLMLGYRGLLKMAYQSGELAMVSANVVYGAVDRFQYQYGTRGFLDHVPCDDRDVSGVEDANKMTHAYALAQLKNTDVVMFDVLTRDKVLQAKAASRSSEGASSPWQRYPDEMWMKTALRHLSKRLPTSIERLATGTTLDEQATFGLPQNLGTLAPEVPEAPLGDAVYDEADAQADEQ